MLLTSIRASRIIVFNSSVNLSILGNSFSES